MNNTINSSMINRSNPAFGSFSQEAKKIITPERIKDLAIKGKLLLSDVNYLAKHKLEIDVKPFPHSDAKGLFLISPYKKPCKNIALTPSRESLFGPRKFKDMGQTLQIALKKAIKIAKKFDKFEAKKDAHLINNARKIQMAKDTESKMTEKVAKKALLAVEGQSVMAAENIEHINKIIQSAKKEITAYTKQEAKLDKKMKNVFI